MHRLLFIWIVIVGAAEASAAGLSLRDSLAMFESGATQPHRCASDKLRGNSGEVSRFQIMPEVWRQYSQSREYENPEVAWSVANQILQDRVRWFLEVTGRNPNPTEIYLLWNKPGHFYSVGFSTKRVRSDFKKRAERFANLFSMG